MKKQLLVLLVTLSVLLLAGFVACGDDDDDDDDSGGSSKYTCADAAEIIYGECGLNFGGLDESEFLDECEYLTSCEDNCIDEYKANGDCTDAAFCAAMCFS